MSEDENTFDLPEGASNYVDVPAFEQILEMDDGDPTYDFSRGLVMGFFEQADSTFEEMEKCIGESDLEQLASLGHFLKGSSATLGIFKVRDSCEKIQHLGGCKDEKGEGTISKAEALAQIKLLLPKMKEDYDTAKKWLTEFFGPDLDDD